MIIKKIVSLCKKNKSVTLFNGEDCQWISDGYSIYPLYGMPYFSQESFCATFDISTSKKDKIYFEHKQGLPGNFNFDDNADGETQCEPFEISIFARGGVLAPYLTQTGVAYIDKAYLEPFYDRGEGYEIFERHDEQMRQYFVVKTGLLLNGIISKANIISQKFVDDLKYIANMTNIALENMTTTEEDKTGGVLKL